VPYAYHVVGQECPAYYRSRVLTRERSERREESRGEASGDFLLHTFLFSRKEKYVRGKSAPPTNKKGIGIFGKTPIPMNITLY